MRAWLLPAVVLAASSNAQVSRLLEYEVLMTMEDDTLVTVINVKGLEGNDGLFLRNRFNFDPEFQSLKLNETWFGYPDQQLRDIPGWAVDTLSGSNGYPLSLVIAFPGLMAGMELGYSLEIRDWSPIWQKGPWLLFLPGDYPDMESFSVEIIDSPEELFASGEGYSVSRTGNGLSVTAAHPEETLWISPFDSWSLLAEFILSDADSVSSLPAPPDLRSATIEAAAAGADPLMAVNRARTLLTESFIVLDSPPGWSAFTTRDVQVILDTRHATPLEMAIVMTSICRELGLSTEIIAATDLLPPVPIPAGWNRFLVRVEGREGRSLLIEPSAQLSPSNYVYTPDTLYMLSISSGRLLERAPNSAYENMCRETWTLNPSERSFSLDLDCRGYYDMFFRRRFGGLAVRELPAALSVWIWRSGNILIPDTVIVSDLFDLGEPVRVHATGSLPSPETGTPLFISSPGLTWNEPAEMAYDVTRIWTTGDILSYPADTGLHFFSDVGRSTLVDSSGIMETFLMMIAPAE